MTGGKTFALLVTSIATTLALGAGSTPAVAAEPAAGPMKVTAKWPKQKAELGKRLRITGKTSQPRSRVVLQLRTRNGPVKLSSTRSDKKGRYKISAPTTWAGKKKVRIVAKAGSRRGTVNGSYVVKNRHSPQGKAKHHNLSGFRHDPCRTLTYRVRGKRLPKGALKDIKTTFRLVSEATGIKFRYAGKTKRVPWKGRPGRFRHYGESNFLVGYVSAKEVPAVKGISGLGGSPVIWPSRRDSLGITNESHVAINVDPAFKAPGGFGPGYTRGSLLMHEVGHAIGLDHAMKKYQIMGYDHGSLSAARFGKGDLAGFRKIGRDRGCVPKADYPPLRRG